MKNDANPVIVAFGWLLVVLAGLWTLFAGTCTLAFLVSEVAAMAQGNRGYMGGSLDMILRLGAEGIIPGALVLWGGIAIVRGQQRSSAEQKRPLDDPKH